MEDGGHEEVCDVIKVGWHEEVCDAMEVGGYDEVCDVMKVGWHEEVCDAMEVGGYEEVCDAMEVGGYDEVCDVMEVGGYEEVCDVMDVGWHEEVCDVMEVGGHEDVCDVMEVDGYQAICDIMEPADAEAKLYHDVTDMVDVDRRPTDASMTSRRIEQTEKRRILKNVFVISFAFMCVFTSFQVIIYTFGPFDEFAIYSRPIFGPFYDITLDILTPILTQNKICSIGLYVNGVS